ncbi:RDD family protein [Methylococcus sp. EFPC2]|uniref:RDD family protein n=1 Tax=Methylococcus sp. EFPC2 TaxID=2812648 RepID=UPI001967820E|nr:RDD family protein [Methylococcus sp. EFPC2]QSA97997.1 RDD family protein [Methylococcus sp. EFPC2]
MTHIHTPAGLLVRLGAMLYDALLLLGLYFVATALLLAFRHGEAIRPGQWAYGLYLLGVGFVFFGWFWTHGGQTLGMRAWKLRLYTVDGGPVGWRQAALRYLCALPSLGLLGLGYCWALLDAERHCWHDRASNTRILREKS